MVSNGDRWWANMGLTERLINSQFYNLTPLGIMWELSPSHAQRLNNWGAELNREWSALKMSSCLPPNPHYLLFCCVHGRFKKGSAGTFAQTILQKNWIHAWDLFSINLQFAHESLRIFINVRFETQTHHLLHIKVLFEFDSNIDSFNFNFAGFFFLIP